MKLFSKPIKYQLITETTWGNSKIDELVLEGTRTDIETYAKKSKFVWNKDETQPIGGFYTRSIDGYRKQTYKIIEAK
jgi:hypothetical protein